MPKFKTLEKLIFATHQAFHPGCQTNYLLPVIWVCFVIDIHYFIKFFFMKRSIFKKAISKVLVLSALCITAFSVTAKAGLDVYEIYLNNKLILKQTAAQPVNLKGLALDKANANDQLVIYYSQCNAPNRMGKARSISVRDANGNILKEWKFPDNRGSNTAMTIPVKELLELEKNSGQLTLYYAAEGRPSGQALTGLHVG